VRQRYVLFFLSNFGTPGVRAHGWSAPIYDGGMQDTYVVESLILLRTLIARVLPRSAHTGRLGDPGRPTPDGWVCHGQFQSAPLLPAD
jgi:hypothetical protein